MCATGFASATRIGVTCFVALAEPAAHEYDAMTMDQVRSENECFNVAFCSAKVRSFAERKATLTSRLVLGALPRELPVSAREIENFGRNVRFTPATFYEPKSEAEVLEILDRHKGEAIRVMGRLHSWSDAVRTEGVLLDLKNLNRVEIEPSENARQAKVGAGCQIKHLLKELRVQGGYTLPSVGLITEQTIAGAIATGTHGSGKHSISHYVEAVRLASYDPETGKAVISEISFGDKLLAARCSLGNLGVIVSVKMEIRRQYNVEEHFRRYKNLADVLKQEKDYPLQQFYFLPWKWNFFAQHRRETDRPKSRLASVYRVYWFLLMDLGLHLLLLFAVRLLKSARFARFLYRRVIPCLVIRNWRVVDDSSSMLVMEHELFRHLEIELFVKAGQLEPALEFVQQVLTVAGEGRSIPEPLLEKLPDETSRNKLQDLSGCYSHHYPICVRRVLPDDTLISMAQGGDEPCYAISLITYEHPNRREGFFRVAEFLAESMAALFAARPHWGKYCPLEPEQLIPLYERFREYKKICNEFDPAGVFRNEWMEKLLT